MQTNSYISICIKEDGTEVNEEEVKLDETLPEVDESSSVSSDKVLCSAALATRIHLAISRQFIPRLQKYLTEKVIQQIKGPSWS